MRLERLWNAIPLDLVALLVIAIAMFVTHRPYIKRGMCFNDPSWYFHFGHRTVLGDVPYRDYVFQVGPLPIYIDALFQKLFSSVYYASLLASLFIKIVRVFVIWLIARRLAGVRAAIPLVVFCALDPLFGYAHHWSGAYAQLFISLSGLFAIQASRAASQSENMTRVYLALSGLSAFLVATARQSAAVMILVVLLAATVILYARKDYFTRQRLAALWGGVAIGIVVMCGALAMLGALGPAIQQMFLDAPEKKAVHGIAAVLDAISGGALVAGGGFTWWGGFLVFLGLPVLVVIVIFVLMSRDKAISLRTIGLLVIPVMLVLGLFGRYAQLNFFSDVPRTFLTALTAVAVLFPDRVRSWFGCEPLVVIGLGALPLASDWALEMSYPGRGWGDAPSLVIAVILLSLATSRISARGKALFCGALGIVAIAGTLAMLKARVNPFAKDTAGDGTLFDNQASSSNRRLRGMRINGARRSVLEWMMQTVRPRSTCFVYGNIPVVYTLLSCKNPTRLDSTAADFMTERDALDAVATLRADPPEFIVAQERAWMNPPLSLDLGDDVDRYDGLNPRASRAMHVGLRALLDQYESVGISADLIEPRLMPLADGSWDALSATRIYRRKPGTE